jgi:hypothetical protein
MRRARGQRRPCRVWGDEERSLHDDGLQALVHVRERAFIGERRRDGHTLNSLRATGMCDAYVNSFSSAPSSSLRFPVHDRHQPAAAHVRPGRTHARA